MTEHPIISVKVYIAVFVALLLLTGLTVAAAYADLGVLNTIAAVTIAAVKALLVVLWFMHLRYSDHLTWIVASAGLLVLVIMISITLSDYLTRGWMGVPGR